MLTPQQSQHFFYRFIPFVRSEIYIPDRISLYQEAQQDTGSYSRTDHTGYVRTHGVHQQVIARIVFHTNDLGNTGLVGHSRYAGITDQRIDLIFFFQHQIENLHENHTGCSSDDE